MSGPKHSEWEVRENARRELARRTAALADIAELDRQFRESVSGIRQHRHDLAEQLVSAQAAMQRPPASASSDVLIGFAGRLRALLTEGRATEDKMAASRDTEMRLSMMATASIAESQAFLARGEAGRLEEIQARRSRLAHLLAKAPPAMTADEKAALDCLSHEMLTCSAGRAQMLEMEIRTEIEASRRREEVAARLRVEASALRDLLLGFDDLEANMLRGRLEDVAAGHMPFDPEMRARVPGTAERLKVEADRHYAAEVLKEEFSALGYDVGEEFTIAFVRGGELRVQRPDQGAYSVDLTFSPGGSSLETELVVSADQSISTVERRRQDRMAEEGWCNDLARIFAGADARKVHGRVTKRTPVGEQPVRVVEVVSAARRPAVRRPAARSLDS